jgi:hypothetical protein
MCIQWDLHATLSDPKRALWAASLPTVCTFGSTFGGNVCTKGPGPTLLLVLAYVNALSLLYPLDCVGPVEPTRHTILVIK